MNQTMELFVKFFTTWLKVGLSLLYKFCKNEQGEQYVDELRDACQRVSNMIADDDYHDVPAVLSAAAPEPVADEETETARPVISLYEKLLYEKIMSIIEVGEQSDLMHVCDIAEQVGASTRRVCRVLRMYGIDPFVVDKITCMRGYRMKS